MTDKYARRRRAVLGAFVIAVAVVLIEIFGQAVNSPLHSVQRGLTTVFSPIGKGVATVVSPIGDLDGWVSSTLHAKSENSGLRKLNTKLNTELAQRALQRDDDRQLQAIEKLNTAEGLNLNQYAPAYANVTEYNPQLPERQISIDRGTSDGVHRGDPVITQGGLVGDVVSAHPHTAQIAELGSPQFAVYAHIGSGSSGTSQNGTLEPEPGHLTNLQLNYVSTRANITTGDTVITASFSDPQNPVIKSPYPPGIPIGTVSSFDYAQLFNTGTVRVTPSVSFTDIAEVEVLTKVTA